MSKHEQARSGLLNNINLRREARNVSLSISTNCSPTFQQSYAHQDVRPDHLKNPLCTSPHLRPPKPHRLGRGRGDLVCFSVLDNAMCVCHVCHAKWDSRLLFTFFGMQGQLNLVGLASDTKSCWRCEEIGWKTEAASFGRGHLAGRSEMGGLRTRNCDYVRHLYKQTLTSLRFLGQCKSLKRFFQQWKQRDIKGNLLYVQAQSSVAGNSWLLDLAAQPQV